MEKAPSRCVAAPHLALAAADQQAGAPVARLLHGCPGSPPALVAARARAVAAGGLRVRRCQQEQALQVACGRVGGQPRRPPRERCVVPEEPALPPGEGEGLPCVVDRGAVRVHLRVSQHTSPHQQAGIYHHRKARRESQRTMTGTSLSDCRIRTVKLTSQSRLRQNRGKNQQDHAQQAPTALQSRTTTKVRRGVGSLCPSRSSAPDWSYNPKLSQAQLDSTKVPSLFRYH